MIPILQTRGLRDRQGIDWTNVSLGIWQSLEENPVVFNEETSMFVLRPSFMMHSGVR